MPILELVGQIFGATGSMILSIIRFKSKGRSRVTRLHSSLPSPQEFAMAQSLLRWHCSSSHTSNYVEDAVLERGST